MYKYKYLLYFELTLLAVDNFRPAQHEWSLTRLTPSKAYCHITNLLWSTKASYGLRTGWYGFATRRRKRSCRSSKCVDSCTWFVSKSGLHFKVRANEKENSVDPSFKRMHRSKKKEPFRWQVQVCSNTHNLPNLPYVQSPWTPEHKASLLDKTRWSVNSEFRWASSCQIESFRMWNNA